MITCWLMHWQTSHLAGSQNAAEMADCLLVIQHNGRVCGCMCVCVCYVWVSACVYLWLYLLLRVVFCAFCIFFSYAFYLHTCVWVCVCFLCDNCALLVSWVPVIICSGGNFSFQIKTQLAYLSANSTEEVCFCVLVILYLCVCVCMPTGKSNQRSCVVERLYKRTERGNRVAGSWEGSMWGWTGGWCRCLILPQPWAFYIPSISLFSTSARGCWGMS